MIRRGSAVHHCDEKRPYANMCRPGCVWMCDDCGQLWDCKSTYGNNYWQKIYNPLRIWWLKRASE